MGYSHVKLFQIWTSGSDAVKKKFTDGTITIAHHKLLGRVS